MNFIYTLLLLLSASCNFAFSWYDDDDVDGPACSHGANNGAGQEKPVAQEQVMIAPAGGNNPNVIEKKEKEPVSIDNSANGPASTDSGTGSADFNSNSTQAVIQPEHPASGGNNNVQHVQANTPPVLPGQATTADAPLIVQGPLIQG